MFLPHFYHAFLFHFINKIKISLKINDLAIYIFYHKLKKEEIVVLVVPQKRDNFRLSLFLYITSSTNQHVHYDRI